MSDKDTFGARMKQAREQRGISLESIAASTKVGVSLWAAMERNDVKRWPSGVFARAYIRDYATLVGLDPTAVVNDFCRLFPIADRRGEGLIRGQAEMIGLPSNYVQDQGGMPPEGDRRRQDRRHQPDGPRPGGLAALASPMGQRLTAALLDLAVVLACAFVAARLFGQGTWSSIAVLAIVYHASSLVGFGRTPASALLQAIAQRFSASRPAGAAAARLPDLPATPRLT